MHILQTQTHAHKKISLHYCSYSTAPTYIGPHLKPWVPDIIYKCDQNLRTHVRHSVLNTSYIQTLISTLKTECIDY